MEISSKFVGSKLRALTTEISARRVMNFAAGVFDDNAIYFDDSQTDGIVAHPMLACAITWDTSKDFDTHLLSDDFPFHLRTQQVHFSESLILHRPIRPGDLLTVEGEIAAILPHRAGTYLVVRYQATDQRGQAVFTEYSGAMLRGVKCLDEGQAMGALPQPPKCRSTAVLWQSQLDIHPLSAHIYDGCGDIHFPIHTSLAFAQSVGLPGIILHGTATVSYAISELLRREADNDPRRVQSLDCCFSGMVKPGEQVTLRLLGHEPNANHTDLYWEVVNQQDKPVISDGRLRIQGV